MAQDITLLGAQYNDVPAVQLPKTGGGTARFDDASITTAVASDVTQGKVFLAADGTITTGTNSGGGGSSNDFIVTLTKDQNDVWQPDKTYAEVYAAYSAGKTIAWLPDDGASFAYGNYNFNSFDYSVYEYTYNDDGNEVESYQVYNFVLSSTGVEAYGLDFEYYGTSNATAVPSDVANGKTFFNADGFQTGTGSGGSSMNCQTAQSTARASSTSYTECITLTCAKTGTYDVYWSTFRNSTGGTWGSQLYLNRTAYGTEQTGSWSNHIQNIHLTNVQINANDEVSVYVRSRGGGYYGYVGTLTIIQTA